MITSVVYSIIICIVGGLSRCGPTFGADNLSFDYLCLAHVAPNFVYTYMSCEVFF